VRVTTPGRHSDGPLSRHDSEGEKREETADEGKRGSGGRWVPRACDFLGVPLELRASRRGVGGPLDPRRGRLAASVERPLCPWPGLERAGEAVGVVVGLLVLCAPLGLLCAFLGLLLLEPVPVLSLPFRRGLWLLPEDSSTALVGPRHGPVWQTRRVPSAAAYAKISGRCREKRTRVTAPHHQARRGHPEGGAPSGASSPTAQSDCVCNGRETRPRRDLGS